MIMLSLTEFDNVVVGSTTQPMPDTMTFVRVVLKNSKFRVFNNVSLYQD